MLQKVEVFLSDESGAVTVDWVVLTAAIVGLGIGVMMEIGGSTENVGTRIAADVSNLKVGYGSSLD
jgi:Flp pilus assembly pilin Flp